MRVAAGRAAYGEHLGATSKSKPQRCVRIDERGSLPPSNTLQRAAALVSSWVTYVEIVFCLLKSLANPSADLRRGHCDSLASDLDDQRVAVGCFHLPGFKRVAHILKRRGGGIEPLHVSMPRELKSRPSTSPTHPGQLVQRLSRGTQVSQCPSRGTDYGEPGALLVHNLACASSLKVRLSCSLVRGLARNKKNSRDFLKRFMRKAYVLAHTRTSSWWSPIPATTLSGPCGTCNCNICMYCCCALVMFEGTAAQH